MLQLLTPMFLTSPCRHSPAWVSQGCRQTELQPCLFWASHACVHVAALLRLVLLAHTDCPTAQLRHL